MTNRGAERSKHLPRVTVVSDCARIGTLWWSSSLKPQCLEPQPSPLPKRVWWTSCTGVATTIQEHGSIAVYQPVCCSGNMPGAFSSASDVITSSSQSPCRVPIPLYFTFYKPGNWDVSHLPQFSGLVSTEVDGAQVHLILLLPHMYIVNVFEKYTHLGSFFGGVLFILTCLGK